MSTARALWIGTDGGLDRYDPATQSFRHYDAGRTGQARQRQPPHPRDRRRRQGRLVGRHQRRPAAFRPEAPASLHQVWHHVPGESASLADDQVNALALDAGGRLWVGTASGLDSLAPGAQRFEHHRAPAATPSSIPVQALLATATRRCGSAAWPAWKCGSHRPVRRRSAAPLGPAEGIGPGQVTVLYQDVDATIWAGTTTMACTAGSRGRAASPTTATSRATHSLADNQVSALYRDRVGTFWVGTWYAA
jgi:ligand-binding sensor domain-containing protein